MPMILFSSTEETSLGGHPSAATVNANIWIELLFCWFGGNAPGKKVAQALLNAFYHSTRLSTQLPPFLKRHFVF
jgi:hypothetical protein